MAVSETFDVRNGAICASRGDHRSSRCEIALDRIAPGPRGEIAERPCDAPRTVLNHSTIQRASISPRGIALLRRRTVERSRC
jgi:hypothetical protein